ncbi:hypothetical protein HPB49_001952 [Dermacentor silvarum]|uniref:Uncharacterized protein n=1 Tax=Dermacentor silvarum TaxID=543639 RepID=A0ACB8CUH4_DERSI|nr:hypothetical protein HPB49_001952 [Dermacentor silvarum]
MASSEARPSFLTATNRLDPEIWLLSDSHNQRTFGDSCWQAPAEPFLEPPEVPRYFEAQNEDHRERHVYDYNAYEGSHCASRNDNGGTIGTSCEPNSSLFGNYVSFPRPSVLSGWRRQFRPRGVNGGNASFHGGSGFRPCFSPWQRPPLLQCTPPSPWAVRGHPTQWRPFPRRGTPAQAPFLFGGGRGGRGGFHNRPPPRRQGDWVHNQEAGSSTPYVPRQSPRICGDILANGQDRPERHRPDQRCDGSATAGRAHYETTFLQNEVMFQDKKESRQHMQRKRTHHGSFRSCDDESREGGGKRDRRQRAEAGPGGRYESRDRPSTASGVAADGVKRSANASHRFRGSLRGAYRDGTKTYFRRKRPGSSESNGEGKLSKMLKSATADAKTETKQGSKRKAADNGSDEDVTVRSKVKFPSDVDPCAFPKRTLQDKHCMGEGKSASKEANELDRHNALLETSRADRRHPFKSHDRRVPAGHGNQLSCGAAEKSAVVRTSDKSDISQCTQNVEVSLVLATRVDASTDSRPNEGTKHQPDKAVSTSDYTEAEAAVVNMLRLIRLQAPKLTDEHVHLQSAVSEIDDTEDRDHVPPTCFQSLDTDSPTQPSSRIQKNHSDTKQARMIQEVVFSSPKVNYENTQTVISTGLDAATELDNNRIPSDAMQAHPVYGVAFTSPKVYDDNKEEDGFDKGPDAAAGPSSSFDINVVPTDPQAPFVCPAEDATAAVIQWLQSSLPDNGMTCISRQANRNRETDAPAISALFELEAEREADCEPETAVISLSREVGCEREIESFPSTTPGIGNDDEDDDEVIVLYENFPARDTASQARRSVVTTFASSDVSTVTTSPSLEHQRPRSWPTGPESTMTNAESLTEDVLFKLNTYTALYVVKLCRDEEAKQQVLQLCNQARRTGATKEYAAEIRRVACRAVERKRVVWNDLTGVLCRLARVHWVLPEAGIQDGDAHASKPP